MSINNNNLIGLDRCRFVLPSIAIDRSVYRMNIEQGEKAQIIDISTGEVIGISDLNVTIKGISLDNKDDYRIKLSLMKKPSVNFILDVNIPKLLYNSNERNANNLEHLSEVNAIIEKKLSEQGIYTDMSKAKLSSIEININNNNPKLYDAMKLIKKGMLEHNDKVFVVENKSRAESLMIKNRYMKVKVYDKTKQLEDTNQLTDNKALIRLEVTTLDSRAITNMTIFNPTLDGIIEHWSNLEKWFKDVINKQIKKPCDTFCKLVVSEMVEQLKQGHKTYDVLLVQAKKGNLVDIDIFDMAMKQYYKEVGKKNPYSIIKNTKARLEKIDKPLYDSLVGNKLALDNLWKELGI